MDGLRLFLRLPNYGVEDGVKFGTKNFVGVRNQFSQGATGSNDTARGRGAEVGEGVEFQFSTIFLRHENEVDI